jgi:hypothetical protein
MCSGHFAGAERCFRGLVASIQGFDSALFMTTRVKGHPTLSKNHALNRGLDTSVDPSKKKKKKTNKKADSAQGTKSSDNGSKQIAEHADIDELFASAKATKDEDERRRQEEEEEEERLADEFEAMEKAARRGGSSAYGIIKSPNMPQIVNPEAPVERIDPETGFPVYKAHLLKVGEGGGTPLCPFDCNCCF